MSDAQDLLERTDRRGGQGIQLSRVEIYSDEAHGGSGVLTTGAPARFVFYTTKVTPSLSCTFRIFNHLGQPVARFSSNIYGPEDELDSELDSCFVCEVDDLPLMPGRYRVDVELWAVDLQDSIEGAAVFDVEQGTLDGRPVTAESGHGDVVLRHRWRLPA
jgi:lipopolysaccharide transport system ATP-binding protein